MENKRILWLQNSPALLATEVPLLRALGYEVYIPKIPPFQIGAVVDWDSDALLTLPEEVLARLNETDFYETALDRETAAQINAHFQIAMFCDQAAAIASMVDHFEGTVVLRAHGRPQAEGSYTDYIVRTLGLGMMTKIEALGKRFVFGESYPGLSKRECTFFRDHTLTLPVSLAPGGEEAAWEGTVRKVLFMCPCIRSDATAQQDYLALRGEFSTVDTHAVGGIQPIRIENDKAVLNNGSAAEYPALYRQYACLFWVNNDPGFLPSLPLDAMRAGMPVVFLDGGVLGRLGGKNDLPGRCANMAQARRKLQALRSGKKSLALAIQKSQAALLAKADPAYVEKKWREAFAQMEKDTAIQPVHLFGQKRLRMAVVLPEGYIGGVLDYTIRLVQAIRQGIEANNHPIDLVFGYAAHPNFEGGDYFKPIREMGIPVRVFNWDTMGAERAGAILRLKGIQTPIPFGQAKEYCVPKDNIAFFADCDFILYTADRFPGFLLPLQPFGTIVHDYVQRYIPTLVPELEDTTLQGTRLARAIYTTTPVTRDRCIEYVGVPPERVHVIPLFFSAKEAAQDAPQPQAEAQAGGAPAKEKKPYFLWSTNTTPHKRHLEALQGLANYYAEGGRLQCYITGSDTEKFSPNYTDDDKVSPHIMKVRAAIQADRNLRKHIKIMGNLPKVRYEQVLAGAKFFFHPGYGDNGNMTAFDAAWKGVPTLSNDYKVMRYYEEYLHLGIVFFDSTDEDSITQALQYGEAHHEAMAQSLPSRDTLFEYTVECERISSEIYRIILAHSGLHVEMAASAEERAANA